LLQQKSHEISNSTLHHLDFNTAQFTNFTNEIVYSPSNPELYNIFAIIGEFVRPFLNINSERKAAIYWSRDMFKEAHTLGWSFPIGIR
jgi:hypothetical protein